MPMQYKSFDNFASTKGLRMMTLNTRSLEGKIAQLKKLYKGSDYVCVTEMWLNSSISDYKVKLPGMVILRNDRPYTGRKRGGGVACYVSLDYLPFTVLCPELCTISKDLETIGILTTKPGQKQRVILTVYKPPKGNTKASYKALLDLVQSPMIRMREIWILGDMNVNIKTRNSTKYGYLVTFLRKR